MVDTNALVRWDAVLRNPEKTVVVADFDGTLAAFDDDPMKVRLTRATVQAGERLAERFGWTAVLTGREDAYAEAHIRGPEIVASNYGAAVRRRTPAPGTLWRDEQFFGRAAAVTSLIERYEDAISDRGITIQRQGGTVMLHWRTLSGAARDRALDLISEIAEVALTPASGGPLVPHWFEHALDIRPAAVTKATGLRRVLMAAGVPLDGDGPMPDGVESPPSICVAVGDDPGSDLEAFQENRRLSEAGFLDAYLNVAAVHPDRPENEELWREADVLVPGAAGVTGFLAALAAGADWHRATPR